MSTPSSASSEPANAGSTEIADILGLKPLEAFQYPFYYYAGGALLGLLGLALMVWAVRKFLLTGTEKVAPSLPPEPLQVVIFRRLEQLKKNLAETPADLKLVHFGLSEIFRDYLEGRYHFPASDWTTEEILAHLQDESIRKILTKTDEVKFAKGQADSSQLAALIQEAISFVEMTCERPAPPPEAAA